MGRYIQSDRIGIRGGLNTFAYVRNRPESSRDPRGRDNPRIGPYFPPTPSAPAILGSTTPGVGVPPGSPQPLGGWVPNGEGGFSNPDAWGSYPGGTPFPGVDRGLAQTPDPLPEPGVEISLVPIGECIGKASIWLLVLQPAPLACGDRPEVCGSPEPKPRIIEYGGPVKSAAGAASPSAP